MSHLTKTSAKSSSTVSTVAFGDYLDRIYDQNKKEAELAYTNHVMAAKELHDAQMRMMNAKRRFGRSTLSLPKRPQLLRLRLSWWTGSARRLTTLNVPSTGPRACLATAMGLKRNAAKKRLRPSLPSITLSRPSILRR